MVPFSDSRREAKSQTSPSSRPSSESRPTTRCQISEPNYPRCIPREFRRTRPLQDARGEYFQWTQATSQRRVETLRSTESHFGLADGVLYGSSKGFKFVDGCSASNEWDALRPDAEMCDKRVGGASRDGTEGDTSGCLHNFQLRRVFLDGLSLPSL